MQLGIIGLPSSGKTTLFKLLTGSDHPGKEWSGEGRVQVQTAMVDVPDLRLAALSEMHQSVQFGRLVNTSDRIDPHGSAKAPL